MKSPLRYPGGKSRYIKHILPYIPESQTLISPFFGGGHIELACMDRGQEVIANDGFPPVANFWLWLKKEPGTVANLVLQKFEDIPDYREIFYEDRKNLLVDDYSSGAAAYFFVNRCSFSGASLSGGFSENASLKRFTESCIERLKAVDLTNLRHIFDRDFEDFLEEVRSDRFVYADPPYYAVKGLYGKNGDLSFETEDHHRLFVSLGRFDHWALSYNDCPEIRDLYRDYRILQLPASKSMSNAKKNCSEILILK